MNKLINRAELSAAANFVDGEWERFKHNLMLGYACIDAGIPVFASDQDKRPLILEFNALDTRFSAEARRDVLAADIEDRRRKFVKAYGREPAIGTDIREKRFVGATLDRKTFKKMMYAFRGLQPVTSISVKPAGLAVIDIDEHKHPGSIELIAGLFEKHGIDQCTFPINPTRSGGLHIYTRHDTPVESNSVEHEGHVWGDLKGKTQVICVGSALKSGKSYGTVKDLERLCSMYKAGTIPPAPKFALDMLRAESTSPKSKSREADIIAEIEAADPVDFDDLFGPLALDCPYDLDALLASNPVFAKRYHNPKASNSQNRLSAANALLSAHPDMAPHHVAAFYSGWSEGAGEYVDSNPGQGEWDNRQVAREILLTRGSLGEGFGAVEDESEDDEENVSPKVQADWDKQAAERADKAACLKAEREASELAERETAELAERERVLTAEIEGTKTSEPEVEKPAPKKRVKGPLIARGGDLWRDFFAPDWSVAGMFPEVGTAMLYGDSNVGKTFVALHLLDRVSRGAPFFGRRTRAADTLYVSSEGGGGLSLRLKALYDAEPFTDVSETIMVRSDLPEFDKSPENAAKKIKLMALEAKKESGRAVGVIVLDNWSLMLGDREENDNGFAAAVFKALSVVADELGCLILVLHHTGKDQKNYRGPSALRASVDAMYGVKMTKELTRECEIECSKLRDGPKPPKMTYKLRTVDVGDNVHGEKITSCLVVEGHDVSTAMGAVDDKADDSTLTPTDTPDDKIRGVLNALTTCVYRSAETTGDDPSEVGASASQVFAQLNTDRKAAGLPELKDRTAAPRLLAKLEATGKVTKKGVNRQTEYRLSD